MNNFPKFRSSFLNEMVFAIKKRSKSLKNRVESYSVERVVEKDDVKSFEKLELDIKLYATQASLRFYFWEDRVAWFDIRIPSKNGWGFEWTSEGRIGSTEPRDIQSSIEKTIECLRLSNCVSELDELWSPILLSGPLKYK